MMYNLKIEMTIGGIDLKHDKSREFMRGKWISKIIRIGVS